nr:aminoglycoside phosphotransferase [Kibdelosporangium sp. MJ126-NF4]
MEAETGRVHAVDTISAGLNSGIAAVLHTAGTSVFIKGLPTDHRRIATQHNEATLAPHVTGIGPALRWQIEADGWNLLGFEHLTGHPADLGPSSKDLAALAGTLIQLGQVRAPDVSLARIERRWAGHADECELALLAGDRLLHTDLNPHNILITLDGARIVDWAWPTLGAAFIDPACAALWLIAEGHTPAAAEAWAATIPAWQDAPTAGIDIFTVVNARLWEQIAHDDPQPWKQRLHRAALSWHEHRHRIHGG